MVADGLATQGGRASAALLLIWLAHIIPVLSPASDGIIFQ